MACTKAEAMPAALKHQQLMDLFKEVIVGAQKEQSTVAQQSQQQSDDQIVAAVRREVAAATHGTDWEGLQAAAQEARRLLEGVADEIKSSVASATHAAKAEIASAVETAAAAAAIQSLGAPCQAGTSQVDHLTLTAALSAVSKVSCDAWPPLWSAAHCSEYKLAAMQVIELQQDC